MKKIMMILAVAAAMIGAASCEKYEDGRPPKDVRQEFNKMYPDAWDVEWEFDGLYWEVDFETGTRPDGTDRTAWYEVSGDWVKTRTELPLSAVPQKIKDYLAASEYGSMRLEDNFVDFYETGNESWYVFEIYVDGAETDVAVTENGEVSPVGYVLFK